MFLPTHKQYLQYLYQQTVSVDQTEKPATQSCSEDFSKILGEGRWYWIHDFVATTWGKQQANFHGIV